MCLVGFVWGYWPWDVLRCWVVWRIVALRLCMPQIALCMTHLPQALYIHLHLPPHTIPDQR
ncbi:MAG: hypothetical protein RLZZ612_1407 [Pseudomonadota bacterium]|jgi:hypothetical protein